jgi:hypothetical protein
LVRMPTPASRKSSLPLDVIVIYALVIYDLGAMAIFGTAGLLARCRESP